MDHCHFENNIDDLFAPNEPSEDINPDDLLNRLEQGIYFNINGNQCPISFSVSANLRINRQSGSANGKMDLTLNFLDQQIAQVARVRAAAINGTFSGQGSQNGTTMAVALNGHVDHLDKGNVKVSLAVNSNDNQNSNRTTSKIIYSFRNFTAVGDAVTTMNYQTNESSEKYYLNGVEVTANEFSEYFTGLSEGENLISSLRE